MQKAPSWTPPPPTNKTHVNFGNYENWAPTPSSGCTEPRKQCPEGAGDSGKPIPPPPMPASAPPVGIGPGNPACVAAIPHVSSYNVSWYGPPITADQLHGSCTRLHISCTLHISCMAPACDCTAAHNQVIDSLKKAQSTSELLSKRLKDAEVQSASIDVARLEYVPVATRASILYFVIADLAMIDPMYQYSLDYFKVMFAKVCTGFGLRVSDRITYHSTGQARPGQDMMAQGKWGFSWGAWRRGRGVNRALL